MPMLVSGGCMMVRGFLGGIALALAVVVSGNARAHEFIVKPAVMTVEAGTELPIAALSSHVFLISQELEAAKDVKVGLYASGKRADIAVKPNEKTLAYEGVMTAPSSGTFIVTGARLPQILATTPDGLKQVTKRGTSVSNPYKIEKFCQGAGQRHPGRQRFFDSYWRCAGNRAVDKSGNGQAGRRIERQGLVQGAAANHERLCDL